MPLPEAELRSLAEELSALYEMPIKLEGCGANRRCLELRLPLNPAAGLKAVMAYRADTHRQGESTSRPGPPGEIYVHVPCCGLCCWGWRRSWCNTMLTACTGCRQVCGRPSAFCG